jgi:CDP-6-deoxy-D-xylo-4-hexulose-3-dehydrase
MIPLMKNAFLNENETKQALAKFIQGPHRLSMSEKCSEFERKFATFQNMSDAVLFNSGGSANLAMLQALKNTGKLNANDKIGFSALTWSTNVMPILQLGMIPVPVDCHSDTLNIMSLSLIERLEKVELKALFLTNALGFAGDLDNIKKICDDQDIILIEDNCEALGTELPSGKTGTFGTMSSFSFFVAHHMSTIEGGMVCTDDPDLAENLRVVRANGWDRNLNRPQQQKWRKKYNIHSDFDGKYAFYDLGYNIRPTEITGFLGCYQLQFLEENISVREKNYIELESKVIENNELVLLNRDHISRLSSFAFPVVCKTTELRKKYRSKFTEAQVEIRPMIAGNIQEQPFYKKYVKTFYDLPETERIHKCGFYSGNYPDLTESDLQTLSNCLLNT